MKIGAILKNDGKCEFKVWSPDAESMEVKIIHPEENTIKMERDEFNYWHAIAGNVNAGTKYYYRINDKIDRPDPASNYQPDDVHKASEVVDHFSFKWEDKNWQPPELKDYIIYELHTGTFTKEGTFESIIDKIKYLKELGITAVEIMPVAQFPGSRNWGYDGVYHYAPQNSYGGPAGLKKLVNALHKNGIAAILDVVYNHFGPEGNYSGQFGTYSNPMYHSPWGDALNFDGPYSGVMRNYFIENALYWFENFHFDALRLDAIDRIYDMSARHFLQELAERTEHLSEQLGKKHFLIAESDLNDSKIIRPIKNYGLGVDAQWSDDFHHSIHSLLTGEDDGYYKDFGKTEDLVKALKETFVYSGQYSEYRKRNHGNSALDRNPGQFIINVQNHDQIGNRAFGDRISQLISFEQTKLAAAVLLLSPCIPLIFMGQEYNEKNPFLYFVSFYDNNLIEAVKKGRREEFSSFNWKEEIPNPQDEKTFQKSKLNWDLINEEQHKVLFDFYKYLINLRKDKKALSVFNRDNFDVNIAETENVVILNRWNNGNKIISVFNFNDEAVTTGIKFTEGNWKKIADSADTKWNGSGASATEKVIGKEQNITIKKQSAVIYEQE